MSTRARHCLVCGGRLRTTRDEGRRRQRCSRCGWTFYDNPVPAVVAIVLGGAGILLARRGTAPYQGTWDLPGGFLEAGEHPEAGLRRELREELGARARIIRLHGFWVDRYGEDGFPILTIVYLARLLGGPKAASDVTEVRRFRADAIPWREIAFSSVRKALRAFVTSRGRTAR